MADTLVSSRMSAAKKEAGVLALGRIGATMSDLINSAVDYVIEHGELPTQARARTESAPSPVDFAAFRESSTLDIDWGAGVEDYKELVRKGRVADYERLA